MVYLTKSPFTFIIKLICFYFYNKNTLRFVGNPIEEKKDRKMQDIRNILGTQYPIIQGAMALIANAELAAAVSNGGGLGIIAAGNGDGSWMRNEIRKARKLTNNPFGVNVMLLSPNVDEVIEVICKEKVTHVTTGAGNPGKYMEKLKKAGIRVLPVVSNLALAVRCARNGADAIIVEGLEAGGHIGETTTMALVPQVTDAVDIPVIAAGGIGDGRGVAAAIMLGASGVQMGTRFVVARECTAAQEYKDMIIKAKDSDTVATGRSTGHPVRVLKNRMTREILSMESKGAGEEELNEKLIGSLRAAVVDGDVKFGSVMSGQIAGLVKKEQPTKEIIEELFTEAKEIYENRNAFFRSGFPVSGNGK